MIKEIKDLEIGKLITGVTADWKNWSFWENWSLPYWVIPIVIFVWLITLFCTSKMRDYRKSF